MQVGAFYLPSVGHMEDIQKGMAGKRTDLYQMMLREITEQLQYMDANGYYGCGFTEHHFHVEGEEIWIVGAFSGGAGRGGRSPR